MKLRSTTSKVSTRSKLLIAVFSVLMIFAVPIQLSQNASADPYADKIKAIENEIQRYQDEASDLAKEARTLENELSKLTAEKRVIQAQVDKSQTKYNKLKADIKQTEKDIAEGQDTLGEILADIHVDDQVSPVELLFSSQTIGDFLDKQEYRSSIRDDLVSTIAEIKDLKADLEEQKEKVEHELNEQKAARNALRDKENEISNLVQTVQGEESRFQDLIENKDKERARLVEEQKAFFISMSQGVATIPDPSKGNYPWAGGCTIDPVTLYSNKADPLGYACRQCTSYAAWKVLEHTGNAHTWMGNANMWPASASSRGIPVNSTPKANTVGVMMPGQYGHVVWVETDPDSEGYIIISQFNYYGAGGPGWGHYSKQRVHKSSYQYYIHF